ncbi:MAG: hypothetical protein DMF56_16985 [Acidobacteria bacterium]|nr:MAG: hypothetical protein DMF56_16985 [Acidobacteriota bacterium]
MTPSLQKVLESKRALRRELASRPVAEKLRMLEAMRERELAMGADRMRAQPQSHLDTRTSISGS